MELCFLEYTMFLMNYMLFRVIVTSRPDHLLFYIDYRMKPRLWMILRFQSWTTVMSVYTVVQMLCSLDA